MYLTVALVWASFFKRVTKEFLFFLERRKKGYSQRAASGEREPHRQSRASSGSVTSMSASFLMALCVRNFRFAFTIIHCLSHLNPVYNTKKLGQLITHEDRHIAQLAWQRRNPQNTCGSDGGVRHCDPSARLHRVYVQCLHSHLPAQPHRSLSSPHATNPLSGPKNRL
jgi:hypothetical protein